MRNERLGYLIRIVAGVYLIYLSVKLIREGILTGDMQGKNMVLIIVACVLFIGAAVFFIVSSIVNLTRFLASVKNQEEEEAADKIEETPEAEAADEEGGEEETPEAEPADEEGGEEETPEAEPADEENQSEPESDEKTES